MWIVKSGELVRRRQIVRSRLTTAKSCVSCGGSFVPRYVFSISCDYCRTPASSYLAVRQQAFIAARAA